MQFTGAKHEVGVDELFFSTTDSKGVIELCNNVFTRLSRYSSEQLIGSPHNIIRHPMMPGGAFYAMWDTLKKGRPFAAYVHNLAQDGSGYDVFATVTPLRSGGYLSVRTRPMASELFAAADSIYAQAFDTELTSRSSGLNRHEAAVAGAGKILEMLKNAGFDSYDAFMYEALPAEVAAREAASTGIARRDDAWGEEANMLHTVHYIYGELDTWMQQMNKLAELSQKLATTSDALRKEAGTDPVPPELAALLTHPDLATVKQTVDVWRQMQTMIGGYLNDLSTILGELRSTVAANRFAIALSRLHTTMLAQFLAEVIDGGEHAHNTKREHTDLLREALEYDVNQMVQSQSSLESLLLRAVTSIEAAIRMVAIPRQMTAIIQAQSPLLSAEVRPLIPLVVGVIDKWDGTMEQMNSLAANCKECTSHDVNRLIELIGYLDEN